MKDKGLRAYLGVSDLDVKFCQYSMGELKRQNVNIEDVILKVIRLFEYLGLEYLTIDDTLPRVIKKADAKKIRIKKTQMQDCKHCKGLGVVWIKRKKAKEKTK